MWITFFFWWFQVKSIIYEFIIHQQMLGWQGQWIKWIWDTFLCDAIIEYNLCQIRISFYQKPEIKDTHPFEDCTIYIYSLDCLSCKGIVKASRMKTCVRYVFLIAITTPQVSIHGAHPTLHCCMPLGIKMV